MKQEKIYLTAYETGAELYAGLQEYVRFYNEKRPHQSLEYQCPAKYIKSSYEYSRIVMKNVYFCCEQKNLD